MKIVRRILIGLVALVVLAYLAALGVLYFDQRNLMYDPGGEVIALADTKLKNAEAVAIPTTDNAVVNGWYEAPAPDKPVILYYKGNADSFSSEHARFEAFTDAGYGFLAFDYRGFPASPGIITQRHILYDALAAYDWLKPKGFPIVIWGRSLGSGPATYVASRRQPEALLLETPFLSAVQVAFDRYPFMPVHLLMLDQFPVSQWIKSVKAPVYIAHGTADRTIDVHNARDLYALVPNKYGLWIIPGADHSDLWKDGIWAKAQSFFADAGKGVGRPGGVTAAAPALQGPAPGAPPLAKVVPANGV
jgi:pimeloyl-ACP methyl ester carboxylesterase